MEAGASEREEAGGGLAGSASAGGASASGGLAGGGLAGGAARASNPVACGAANVPVRA